MADDDRTENNQDPPIDPELAAEANAVLAEVEQDEPVIAESDDAEEAPEVPLDEIIRQLFDITFNGFLKARGEHWAMPQQELTMLSQAYAAVILKYWPDLNLGVEFTAVVVTMGVIGPRVATDVALRRAEKDKAGDEAKEDDPPAADAAVKPAKKKASKSKTGHSI